MFKKLKDKIAEDLKFSPQRLTQGINEKTQSISSNDEHFFSIAEDDIGASTSSLGGEFTDVSLHASTPMEPRNRKLSNSSMASDISFLPRYEPSGNLYHMQSDLDASASELEDNASTSSQLGHISKEQVYSAFQKAQMRYHKYRGRYTDLANHYKILEKENSKVRTILVDTQDKAIRRVNELKEQCGLEQKAKAHLENALRVELDEKQIKIDTLHTKIKLLQNGDRSDQLVDVSDNSRSTSNSSLSDYQELTKYLNDARAEIENLNGKLQEMKANTIIFNTKEADYKTKIHHLEKLLQERNSEVNQYSEREKENNLKLAQSKMELHAEIHNKDLEIANLKKDLESLRHETDKNKNNSRLDNLQSQNGKLIDKVDALNQKCSNYESELIKLEQYKIEIGNLNEIVLNLKKINEELVQKKLESEAELKRGYDQKMQDLNEFKIKLDVLQKENEDLKSKLVNSDQVKEESMNLLGKVENLTAELEKQKKDYEETTERIRDEAKQSLLMLETKIKEKVEAEFSEKESILKDEYESNINKLMTSDKGTRKIEIDLLECQDLLSKVQKENSKLRNDVDVHKLKYSELETNHLELINESSETRKDVSLLEKENGVQKNTIASMEGDIQLLRDEISKLDETILSEQNKNSKMNEEVETLKGDLLNSAGKEDLSEVLSQKIDEINKMRDKNDETQNMLSQKEDELVKMKKIYGDDLDSKVSEYQVLESEFSLLQEVSSKQQNENCTLQEEKRNFEAEVARLKVDLDQEVQLGNQKEKLFRGTIANLQEQLQELTDLNKQIKDYEQKELEATNAKLLKKIEELTKLNHNQEKKCYKTTAQMRELREKIEEYKTEELRWNEISLTKNEELAKLNVQIEEYKNQELKLNEMIKNLKENLEELSVYQLHLNEANTDLNLKLAESTKMNEQIQGHQEKESNLKETIQNLEDKLKNFEEENSKLSENLQNLLKNNTNFTEEISKYTEANIKLKNENKNHVITMNDRQNEIKTLKDEVKHKEKENQHIKDNLTKAKSDFNEIIKEKDDIFTRLMKAEQNNGILKEKQIKVTSEYDNYKKETETEKIALNETIDHLKQYEIKYQSILDENQNLKEQISKIEELRLKLQNLEGIESNFEATVKEKAAVFKDLQITEKQKSEIINENKKLKQEILDLKVLNEGLKGVQEENRKLVEDIFHLQSQFNQKMNENQNLSGDLSRYHQMELKFNDISREVDELTVNCRRLSNENAELLERNQQLASDYKQILHENEMNASDFAEVKLRYEETELENGNFEEIKQKFLVQIENLKRELDENKFELTQIKSEKTSLEKLQSTTLESSENQTSTLKTKIQQLQEEKSDYESLFNEYKQMKTDINNVTQLYDKCAKEKKEIENQLRELERHYSEITHEKQLLKDEIQELKISPINLTTKKLENLEVIKSEKKYVNEENYIREIEGLRDKLEQYKSIDKANRSSIEFYENELQKIKVKNEKLSRRLDDTLVTLPALTSGVDLGDSQAKLEYLRNVLYNYMIGRESLVLAKVISAVCKFDKDQTELVLQKEQQRQTLIGQLFGS